MRKTAPPGSRLPPPDRVSRRPIASPAARSRLASLLQRLQPSRPDHAHRHRTARSRLASLLQHLPKRAGFRGSDASRDCSLPAPTTPTTTAPPDRDLRRSYSPSRSAPVFRPIATCVAPTKTMPTPVARCRSAPAAIFGRGPVRFGAGGADRRPWRQNWLKLDPGQPLSIFTLRLRNKHLDWKRTVREISHGFPTLPRRDRDIGRRPSCVHSTPRSPVAKP